MGKVVLERGKYPELDKVGKVADTLGVSCYVVGGFVRDLLRHESNDDFDFVVEGSGIELARKVADMYGGKLSVYESYGTASVNIDGCELEFVGCRKEFYHRESRNPIVEEGTLIDDLSRRDFTINAMAVCVNNDRYGELIDEFDGENDLNDRIIRCVGDPNERFNEDPLRILRGVRFAGKICGTIDVETLEAMRSNAKRFDIIVPERRMTELSKMITGPFPGISFQYFYDLDLEKYVLPPIKHKTGGTTPFKDHRTKDKADFFHHYGKNGLPLEAAGWQALFFNVLPYEYAAKEMRLSNKLVSEMKALDALYSLYDIVYCNAPGTDGFGRMWRYVLNHVYSELPGYDMSSLLALSQGAFDTFTQAPYGRVKGDVVKHNELSTLLCKLDNPVWRENHGVVLHTDGDEVMRVLGIAPGPLVKKVLNWVMQGLLDGTMPDDPKAVAMYLEYVAKPFYESHKESLDNWKL